MKKVLLPRGLVCSFVVCIHQSQLFLCEGSTCNVYTVKGIKWFNDAVG